MLACLAICPAMHLQDCHSLPTAIFSPESCPNFCWWRRFVKLMQGWLTTTYLLFGCFVLCLYRNAFVFPWVMGSNMHRQWRVSTLSVHMATLRLHSPCSICTPHASSQGSSAIAVMAQCHCTRADLPQPVGCFGAILWRQFNAKGPHNSSGFGLLYLFYRESPAAVQHKVTFTVGRLLLKHKELHQTVRYGSDIEQTKLIFNISPQVPALRDL